MSIKIGICGNIQIVDLANKIELFFPGNEIIIGEINEFSDELTNCEFGFKDLNICIIALDWEKLVPEVFTYTIGDNFKDCIDLFRLTCNRLKELLISFRKNNPAKILVFSPIWQSYNSLGFISRNIPNSPYYLKRECEIILVEFSKSLSDLYLINLEEISSNIGQINTFNFKSYYESCQPFSHLMINAVADHIIKVMHQFLKNPIKCLVLDLDNTIWGGEVGEIGVDKITLSNQGKGLAFQQFQKFLLNLHKQGLLLAICSKNNTCNALEALELHPHNILRPNFFTSYRINWDDKAKNILEIAKELNIGLDSIMFIDDDPVERELVRKLLPDVEIFELPSDPYFYKDALCKCSRLWPLQITKEDTNKGKYYKSERQRKDFENIAQSKEKYLQELNIQVSINLTTLEHLPRVTQLFNKTNQFNLTTIRYSESDLEQYITNKSKQVFHLFMQDKFGEYGIISAAVLKENLIESFVLSCRAFGRNVEFYFLNFLMQYLKNNKNTEIYGKYITSKKNLICQEFYKTMNFTLINESNNEKLYKFTLAENLPLPHLGSP